MLRALGSKRITRRDFLPRLAAKFESGIGTDCTEFKIAGDKVTARRPVYGGKCSKEVEFVKLPAMVSIRPNVLALDSTDAKTPKVEKVSAEVGQIRAKLQEIKASQTRRLITK